MAETDQTGQLTEAAEAAQAEAAPDTTRTLGALPVEARSEARIEPVPMRPVRLPAEHDPAPNHGRLLLLSAWTAVLVLLGLVAAARVIAAILLNSGPNWLVPASVTIGTLGVIAAGVAFASIHRATWAYAMLGASTVALFLNLTLVLVLL